MPRGYVPKTCIDCGDVVRTGNRCTMHQDKYNARLSTRKAYYADTYYRSLVPTGACTLCHKASADTIDHIISINKGGTNDPSNLRFVCKSCNSSKGATIDKNQ